LTATGESRRSEFGTKFGIMQIGIDRLALADKVEFELQTMEALFPGSTNVRRRFEVEVVELTPGATASIGGVEVRAWQVLHPSGAIPFAFRLSVGGKVVGYTGDTEWTNDLVTVASGADLLIAGAYFFDKPIPYHMRYADLAAHKWELTSRRIVLTHMAADMLGRLDQIDFDTAYDGLIVEI